MSDKRFIFVCVFPEWKHGWGYTLGFFAMMLGHQTWYKDCAVNPKE